MPSTRQATSLTPNTQLFIDALLDYTVITGTDLSEQVSGDPKLKLSDSPEATLQLLQEREKAFREYRDSNPKLLGCLSPVVNILWGFSRVLGREADLVSDRSHLVSLLTRPRQVPIPPPNALFAGIDLLLDVRPLNTLFNKFLCDV